MTVVEPIGLNLRRIRRRTDMSRGDLARTSGIEHIVSTGGDARDLVESVGRRGPARWDPKGWFTFDGMAGPVDVRPDRPGGRD